MEVTGDLSQHTDWTRSDDGFIAGVCQGIADQFDIDVLIVRLGWLFSLIFLGSGFLLYLAFWISLPRQSRIDDAERSRILGVCRRVAHRQNISVGLVRLIALLLTGLSFGATLVGYLVLHVLLPQNVLTSRRESDF